MTKKLRQQFPDWIYIADEQLKKHSVINQNIVFYWTRHGSHKMMRYVYKKLPENVNIFYVTATNLSLLLKEMNSAYWKTVTQ